MPLRIETPMALTRPVEATAEKAAEISRQGLNAPAMKRDEAEQTERKLRQAQAVEEPEGRRVQNEERGRGHGGQTGGKEGGDEATVQDEDQLTGLKRRAAQRMLGLSVEPSKRDKRGERRLDIEL